MTDLSHQGPDKDLPDEQQLDEYLRGGSAVSRQYRQLPSADVPGELDRLVLRQAQEAVKSQPRKSRAWVRWTGPLALAASTVLVVSIVIESGVHEQEYLTVPASAPAEVRAQRNAIEAPAATVAADKSAAEADLMKDEARDDASVVHVVPVQPPLALEMVMSPPAIEAAPAEPAEAQDRSLAIQPAAPMPAPAPAPVPAPEQATARSRAPQGQTPRPIEEVQVQAYRAREVIQESPTSAMSTERDHSGDLEEVAVTGIKRPRQRTAGPRNTVMPGATGFSIDADEEQADEPRSYSDPEQWLRDIRELRKQNKHEEADREWRRFRYVYPNYQVADDDAARGSTR